ncbi:hypothetical protein ACHAWO_009066 [Cyclotella atomus]|uniref:AP2/ERF domain-containing protein n=1 Tax=Cyclotella atomus TaxID=382360 RepID=A0ABD3P6Y1_9STRA
MTLERTRVIVGWRSASSYLLAQQATTPQSTRENNTHRGREYLSSTSTMDGNFNNMAMMGMGGGNNMGGGGGGGGERGGGKKAVHVKWAGKTIALGTFPSAEADEKCARAKALTRAWRSTMRPKPSREWVMLELERLQVRIVSGRLGRKGDGDDDDSSDGSGSVGNGGDGGNMNNMGGMGMMGNMGGMQGNMGDNNNHRPFVGGGPAAAFEAARADHYNNKGNNNNGMGGSMNNMGNNMGGGGNPNLSNLGLSVNPNQHYEM